MKKRNISRRMIAILLAFIVMLSTFFHQGIDGRASEWTESIENRSIIATDTDANHFNMDFFGINFLENLQTLASADAVYDVGDAYYGEHKKTNIYSLNHEITVYCGDHNKMYPDSSGVSVTVSSAEDSSLSALQKENLRKVLYYNTIYNFVKYDDQIAMTHLALDYYKNGNNDYTYASDFIRYIDAAPTVLSASDARIYVDGTDINNTQSGTNTHTEVSVTTTTNTPNGQRQKRTKLLTLRGADSNSVTVTVPSGVTMWVYEYNPSTGKSSYYDKSDSGDVASYTKQVDGGNKVTLNVRDQFLFTSPLTKAGNSSIEKASASKSGYNVMQCYHNDAYQTWYYLGSPQTYSISLNIEWGDAETTAISVRKRSSNENISNNNYCYAYEGAVYDVYHVSDKNDSIWGTTGTRVGRFIMKDTGTGIAQTEYCKKDEGYNVGISPQSAYLTNLPYGWYRVQEVEAPSGYALNKETIMVDLTDGGIDNRYDVTAYDEPIFDSAGIQIFKRDAQTGEKVQGGASLEGAEFTIQYYDGFYDKISDLPAKATRTWVLKTDEDGFCSILDTKYIIADKSDALYTDDGNIVIPLGTITIEETNAPKGYTLDNLFFKSVSTDKAVTEENGVFITKITSNNSAGNIIGGNEYEVYDYVVRGDIEFKKTDETGKPIANVKFSITDISDGKKGESHIVWTDENGYYSTASSYIKHSKNTNNEQPGSGIWFGDVDVDDNEGALPYGTYEIQELRCDANKETYKNADPVTVKVEKNAVTVDAGTIIDHGFPIIHTTAKDAVTNNHTSSAALDEVTLTDGVEMLGLDKGHIYTLHTALMDKETEEILIVENGDVTAETTFTADKAEMLLDIDMTFSSIGLDGKDVVFYEYLTDVAYPGEIIARHEDINDAGQTIHFVKIGTTATVGGAKEVYSSKNIAMDDVVSYEGLTKGETYTVKGILMDYDTKEPYLSNGKEVTAEAEFVAEAENGSVKVTFTFDCVTVKKKQIVAFEEVYYEDYLLAVHADIEDDGQTITIKPARGDLELKKVDEDGKALANVKFSITNKATGESHIVWTDENGYYSTSASYIKHTKNTNDDKAGSGIWFSDEKVDDSLGALPYGTYVVEELRCEANFETYKSADPVTVTLTKNKQVITMGDIVDEKFPEIHTTARDTVTNNHTSSAALDEVTLTDGVEMLGLDKGHIYTLHTALMDKETEEILIVENGDVTAETTFTADKAEMLLDIDMTFSSIGLDGKDVVFYEYLTDSAYPGEIIARHEDINDPDQTIHFVEIHTTATGMNGEKVIYTTKDIMMKDVVDYKGLTEGETYTVTGVLMDKETEEEFLSNGEIVTAETEFVAEAENGSVEVEFTFSGVNLGVKEIVAFEELYYEDYLLAVHADINDDGQSITTNPNPTLVSKKDATTDEELPGATLSLYDEEDKLVDTWVSTTEPHEVENLPAGTYRLVEEMAPLGYLLSEDVTFEVLADGTVTEVEMYDSYAIVAITKVDAVTGEALSGAEFTLYDVETDEVVMTAVSDEEGYAEFIKVAPGEYYIKETAFPDGYTVYLSNPDNITYVTVEENQYTNAAPIILFNQYSRVCVYKIDSKSKKALAGAEFTLYDAKTDAVIGKAISDADGYAAFEDVDPGEYYIKETNAPEGYLISDEKIYIDTSKTNYTMAAPIVMENTLVPDTPRTGDSFPMIPIALVAGLSAFGIIAVLVLKKRKKFF